MSLPPLPLRLANVRNRQARTRRLASGSSVGSRSSISQFWIRPNFIPPVPPSRATNPSPYQIALRTSQHTSPVLQPLLPTLRSSTSSRSFPSKLPRPLPPPHQQQTPSLRRSTPSSTKLPTRIKRFEHRQENWSFRYFRRRERRLWQVIRSRGISGLYEGG